jgi:hypothetical protein
MTEIREALRAWLDGAGLRMVAERAGVDRKTARRYVQAAVNAGLARDGGERQLTDELLGQVAGVVRPVRPGGHGSAWDALEACQAQVKAWVVADHAPTRGRRTTSGQLARWLDVAPPPVMSLSPRRGVASASADPPDRRGRRPAHPRQNGPTVWYEDPRR